MTYVERTSDKEIGIHTDFETAELILESICLLYADFPPPATDKERIQKRKMIIIKNQIEEILNQNNHEKK